jgi:hypothetical protein
MWKQRNKQNNFDLEIIHPSCKGDHFVNVLKLLQGILCLKIENLIVHTKFLCLKNDCPCLWSH